MCPDRTGTEGPRTGFRVKVTPVCHHGEVEAGPPEDTPDEESPEGPSASAEPDPSASEQSTFSSELPIWPPPSASGAPPLWLPPAGVGSPQSPPAAFGPPGIPESPGRCFGVWRWVAAGIIALVLVAGAVAVAAPRLESGPSYPSTWDPRVSPIAQFVQNERGLDWKHPVKVEFLPASQFQAVIGKKSAQSNSTSSTTYGQGIVGATRALGLISGNVDLAKSAHQFLQTDVVGLYVDTDRTVYVRGDTLTPYVRSVLAHELTHALQAQYFNLQKIRSGHKDDDSAVTALIEGDAVRVQNAYEQTLSAADQKLLVQEEQQSSGQVKSSNDQQNIPEFLVDQSEFPYDFGPTFVAALVSKGGNAAVDAAFRNPPLLDSQIVDPDSYTPGASTPTVHVPAPPRGAHQLMSPSGFGQVTLTEMLGDQLGFAAAWQVAQHWRQDQWVPYTVNGKGCANLAVLTDAPASALALLQTGRTWASHLPSATVSQAGSIVYFHSCDPGVAWKPAQQVDDPYQALAVRSVLTYQLITDAHLNAPSSICAADQVETAVGAKGLEAAEQAADPNSPAVQSLRSELLQAVRSCQNQGPAGS